MEVCETCGAFLIVGDAQSRVDDHLMGKQHMGYAKIKLTIEELLVIIWIHISIIVRSMYNDILSFDSIAINHLTPINISLFK